MQIHALFPLALFTIVSVFDLFTIAPWYSLLIEVCTCLVLGPFSRWIPIRYLLVFASFLRFTAFVVTGNDARYVTFIYPLSSGIMKTLLAFIQLKDDRLPVRYTSAYMALIGYVVQVLPLQRDVRIYGVLSALQFVLLVLLHKEQLQLSGSFEWKSFVSYIPLLLAIGMFLPSMSVASQDTSVLYALPVVSIFIVTLLSRAEYKIVTALGLTIAVVAATCNLFVNVPVMFAFISYVSRSMVLGAALEYLQTSNIVSVTAVSLYWASVVGARFVPTSYGEISLAVFTIVAVLFLALHVVFDIFLNRKHVHPNRLAVELVVYDDSTDESSS